jgi:hypothetical protein
MVKKVVIAGSSSLKEEMKTWVDYWNKKPDHFVIDWPQTIDEKKFVEQYPKTHKSFYENITITDIVFIANEDKNEIEGYIGAETFAELAFSVAQNLLYNKNIDIILAKIPSSKVQSSDDVALWLKLGWIRLLR